MKAAQSDADARWRLYEQVAGVHRTVAEDGESDEGGGNAAPAAPAPGPKEVEQ